jgi:hypothetical protein
MSSSHKNMQLEPLRVTCRATCNVQYEMSQCGREDLLDAAVVVGRERVAGESERGREPGSSACPKCEQGACLRSVTIGNARG